MNVWIAKGIMLAACVTLIAIRAPYGQRSRGVKTIESRKGAMETFLLTVAWFGFLVPLIWIASPALSFAEYPLRAAPLMAGTACLAGGLWLFHRAHADLGTNWSITLELREQHRLITNGVYRRIRHPMYAALLLYSAGQALVIPNWVAGPSYLFAMGLLLAFRLRAEEAMLLEHFGDDYAAYVARAKRLVPGMW